MAVTLKWFPPSWCQIKATNSVVYVDPAYLRTYFTHYPKKIEFSKWPDPIDGLPEDLKRADIILVTHHHKDHCKRITLDRLRRTNTVVAAPERCITELGEGLRIVKPGDEMRIGRTRIRVVAAYNTEKGRSTQKVHRRGNGVGYLITLEGKTIYHAGDTDFIPEMKSMGPIDVALLPIGGRYTMDIIDAVKAASAIQPQTAIPIHRMKADPLVFKRKVEEKSETRVVPLEIGELLRIK